MEKSAKRTKLLIVLTLIMALCVVFLVACGNDSQAAPTLAESSVTVSGDTITVASVNNALYSKDSGANWQESNVFSGLNYGVEYKICIKLKSGDKLDESPISNIISKTLTISAENTSATTVAVSMVQREGVSFTWNGSAASATYSDGKYIVTVPTIKTLSNTLLMSGAGTVSLTVETKTAENLKVAATSADLNAMIDNQADGQIWLVKAGTYDIARDNKFPNEEKFIDMHLIADAYNWYMPIYRTVEIYGIGNPTLMSSTQSANADYSTQEFIKVVADDVVIDGFNIQGKLEANKIINISGNNFTLKNCEISPYSTSAQDNTTFAGTIYFQYKDGSGGNADVAYHENPTATIENVNITKGRISGSNATTNTVINLKNVNIDFTGLPKKQYDTGSGYGPITNAGGATINYTNVSVRVGLADGHEDTAEYVQNVISSLDENVKVTLAEGEYSVSEAFAQNVILEEGAVVYLLATDINSLEAALASENCNIILTENIISEDKVLELKRDCVIDFGGKTLSVKQFIISNGANVSLKNSSKVVALAENKVANFDGQILITGEGTAVSIESGVYKNKDYVFSNITDKEEKSTIRGFITTVIVEKNATLEITGGEFKSDSTNDEGASIVKTRDSALLTITGGKFESTNYGIAVFTEGKIIFGGTAEISAKWSGISSNNLSGRAYIEINGGTVTSTEDAAIFLSATGTFKMTSGKLIGATAALDVRNGDVEINGGTLEVTGDYNGHEINAGPGPRGVGSVVVLHTNKYYSSMYEVDGAWVNGAINETNAENAMEHTMSVVISENVVFENPSNDMGRTMIIVYDWNALDDNGTTAGGTQIEQSCSFSFGEGQTVKYFNKTGSEYVEVSGLNGPTVESGQI